jgi:hypothetical protein
MSVAPIEPATKKAAAFGSGLQKVWFWWMSCLTPAVDVHTATARHGSVQDHRRAAAMNDVAA